MNITDAQVVNKVNKYKGFFAIDEYTVKHKLFNGQVSKAFTRELFERGNASAVLLYDPKLDSVVLIEQFRIGALVSGKNPWLIEVVAGINEDNELPEDVVRRECFEESGLELKDLKFITDFFVSPGGTSERISLFIGIVDSSNATGNFGLASENEDIMVHRYKFEDALDMVDNGTICNATTIIALQYLALHKSLFGKES